MDTTTGDIFSRFTKSWNETEKVYNELIDNYPGFNLLIPLYSFIQKLKQAGENKFFRLSTSMQALIFSRSVEPGLRQDQKFIKITAYDNSFVVTLRDGTKMYRQYTIKDLDDERLTGLLQTLKDTLID
jgi:hypothetical protein